uniref:Maf-like protein n=1 Tax=Gossypium raimondii TaxID=29730 RepID=A0A0D2RF20_GOSRA|nr:hypothetical protein B456_003G014500 [Gossypium raimondii]
MAAAESCFKIILGSSSMARQRILAEMGYEFTIMTADIDEKSIRKEKPEDLVTALAEAKANAIMARLQHTDILENVACPTLLITADTVVVYKGTIREKPCNEDEAREFIKGLFNVLNGDVLRDEPDLDVMYDCRVFRGPCSSGWIRSRD